MKSDRLGREENIFMGLCLGRKQKIVLGKNRRIERKTILEGQPSFLWKQDPLGSEAGAEQVPLWAVLPKKKNKKDLLRWQLNSIACNMYVK